MIHCVLGVETFASFVCFTLMTSYLWTVGLISWEAGVFLRMSLLIATLLMGHFWVWGLCQACLCGWQGYCLFVPLVTARPTRSIPSWPGIYQGWIIYLCFCCVCHLCPMSSILSYVAVATVVLFPVSLQKHGVCLCMARGVLGFSSLKASCSPSSSYNVSGRQGELCLVNTSIPLGEVVPVFLCLTWLYLCFWELLP